MLLNSNYDLFTETLNIVDFEEESVQSRKSDENIVICDANQITFDRFEFETDEEDEVEDCDEVILIESRA